MVEISYKLSEADCLEAVPRAKLFSRFGFALALIASAIIGIALIYVQEKLLGTALIVFVLCLLFDVRRRVRVNVREQFQQAPFLHGEIRAHIDGAGIIMSYSTGSSTTAWDGFQSGRETEHLLILYLSPGFYRAFPKRAFSPNQLREFMSLLQEHKILPST
jgi:hypothetical protein